MRAQLSFFIVSFVCTLMYLPNIIAQNPDTKQNFEVHREYDEEGNLIYYDSVSVSVWNSDISRSNLDSTDYFWDNEAEFGNSDSLFNQDPFFFGFHSPDDEDFFSPGFDIRRDFGEFDKIIREFRDGFDYTPSDSSFYFYFPGPPESHKLESNLLEMQKRMEEILLQHEKMMKEFFNNDFQLPPPDSPVYPDSIPEPLPAPQKYDPSIIHI